MKISKQTVLYVVLGISLAVNAYVIGVIGYYSYKIKSIGKDTTWIEKRLDRNGFSVRVFKGNGIGHR